MHSRSKFSLYPKIKRYHKKNDSKNRYNINKNEEKTRHRGKSLEIYFENGCSNRFNLPLSGSLASQISIRDAF